MKVTKLMTASAIIALVAAQPALAQSTPSETSQVNEAQAGDIVVTAQRRSQSLQKVPIAITVVSGQSLEQAKITKVEDLPLLAPSLKFQPGGTNGDASFSIRGIGTGTFDTSVEQSVSAVVDDVVQLLPRVSPVNTLVDLDRIEILRGPQGTLFGKNTTAGVISITTTAPKIGEFSDQAHAQYGELNELRLYDILNVPLSDTLAARFRAVYQRTNSQLQNVFLNDRPIDSRDIDLNGKLLWEPTAGVRINLQGDYQESHAGDAAIFINANNPANPTNFASGLLARYGVVASRENRKSIADYNSFSHSRTWGGQANIDVDLGGGNTLTSITAGRWARFRSNDEGDQTPLPLLAVNTYSSHSRQFSEEVRIASPTGHFLEYVVGAYYSYLKVNDNTLQAGTLGFLPASSPFIVTTNINNPGLFLREVSNRSIAGFAELTAHPTSTLRLILGGRVTNDRSAATIGFQQAAGVCQLSVLFGGPCFPNTAPANQSGVITKTGWSGRAGVQYDVTDDVMAYFTASRGYKAAAETTTAFLINPVRPETVVSFELGVKSRLFDRRGTLNIDLYTSKFTDFQAQSYDARTIPATFIYTNAGSLSARGVEADLTMKVAKGLDLTAGGAYNFTKYNNYFPACPLPLRGTSSCLANGSFNASGQPLPNAPRWTANAAASYSAPINATLKIDGGFNVNYRSSTRFQVGDAGTRQGGYAIANGTLGIATINDRYRVGIYARNIFDRNVLTNISPYTFEPGLYIANVNIESRRTVGGELDIKFGG